MPKRFLVYFTWPDGEGGYDEDTCSHSCDACCIEGAKEDCFSKYGRGIKITSVWQRVE